MHRITSTETLPITSEWNVFEILPNEPIREIALYLTPQKALQLRLVNRRFSKLFGDSRTWHIWYRSLGLVPPKMIGLQQAKKLPLWISLKKFLDSQVEFMNGRPNSKEYWREYPHTFCLVTLLMPELSPLHAYAMKILREHCKIPKELSADEIILSAAKGDRNFLVKPMARILAIKSLGDRSTEPKVQEALISILSNTTNSSYENESFCREAVQGLGSSITDPKVQEAVLICLRHFGPFTVRPAFDALISNREGLEAVVSRYAGGSCGLDDTIRKHLIDASVVEYLVQRLYTERNSHLVAELARALGPVIDQEPVQRVFCQRILGLTGNSNWHERHFLFAPILDAKLFKEIKADYQDRIDVVQKKAVADEMLELINGDVVSYRQRLITTLCSENTFEKEAAATLLAPFVQHDPEILAAFVDRIMDRENGRAAIIIVSALAKLAHREDIRLILINEGPLTGKLSPTLSCDNRELRLATIQVLRPFLSEPEVFQAFLSRFKSDEYPTVRCTLIDILAPHLDNPEVLTLFLDAAKDKLWRHSYHSGSDWQVAAIDKLEKMLHVPEVKKTLLELLEKSSYAVKAACVRALGSRNNEDMITIDNLLKLCIDQSADVSKEARRALISRLKE